ncbi:MAG TPA: flagellar biosynthesis protein FlgA [Firmicutes bacterium]|nr:flagellar biosynthesis protein FlgA [Bacillota bacterium]
MLRREGLFSPLSFLLILLLLLLPLNMGAEEEPVIISRIKDVARLEEDRANQLTGFGLVVGLNGTGDNQSFSLDMVLNFLAHHGFVVNRSNIRVKNVAAVALSATLPPYKRSGDTLEVTVSSLGDAKSLQGGVLLQSPLAGADGNVYAVAQGPVVVSGFTAAGSRGSRQTTNQPTVGLAQALVENEVPVERAMIDTLRWVLFNPDFSTANTMATAINSYLGEEIAYPETKADVRVKIPEGYQSNPVEFIALIEKIQISRDQTAKVVVNPRSGTIVFDENVRIAPVAVTRGNITVRISSEKNISQPPPFSAGETVVTDQETLEVTEEGGSLVALPAGTAINEVVRALNAVGATPQDIISLLIAIDQAGALHGVLEIR